MLEDAKKQPSSSGLLRNVFLFIQGSSSGKGKFEQDCLESYAGKFGL